MSGKTILDAGGFWTQSAALYAPRQSALIALQDQHGASVNLVLLYLWMDQAGWSQAELDQARLHRKAEDIEAQQLRRLRDRRRRLKGTWGYSTAKDTELKAERRAQQHLLAAAGPLIQAVTPALVRGYLQSLGATAAEIDAAAR